MSCNRSSRPVVCTMPDDKCTVCNKEIEGRIITALGKKWHPEHFTCSDCKKPIECATFHEKEGKVYCVDDYVKNHVPQCHSCKKPITANIIKALDVHWHEEHFVCKKCKKPFGDKSFMQRDGDPYCNKCNTELFAARCNGCSKPIESKSIIAFEKKWHPECFKCGKCSKPVTESSFAVSNGKPLCGKC